MRKILLSLFIITFCFTLNAEINKNMDSQTSFKTNSLQKIRETFLEENFENNFPPENWTAEPNSGDGTWVQDNGTTHGPGSAFEGNFAAMFNNYNYSSGVEGSLITPELDLTSSNNPIIKFAWWNNDGSSSPATLKIFTKTSDSDFELLDTIETFGSGEDTWTNYQSFINNQVTQVKFTAISDYGMKNTFVDHFCIEEGPTTPIPTLNMTEADFGEAQVGTSTNPYGDSFSITNTGVGTLTVENITNLEDSPFSTNFDTSIELANGESQNFGFTFSPIEEGIENLEFIITTNAGDAVLNLTGEGFILDEGLVQIGTGAEVDKSIPCEPAWHYTYSQSLYLQEEINIADQQIKQVFYEFNGNSSFTDEDVDIYMGHTQNESVSDWIPVEEMELVYSGPITTQAEQGWVEINLDAPFEYNNSDNLIIAFDENTQGAHSYEDDYLCSTTSQPMSIVDYNNENDIIPSEATADNMPTARPNIRLQFEEISEQETGFISGFIKEAVTEEPISGAEINAGIFQTETNNDGSFSLEVNANTYDVIINAEGYTNHKEEAIEVLPNETVTLNAELNPIYTIMEEGFEEGICPPNGWSVYSAEQNNFWRIWEFEHTGEYAARYETAAEADDWLITPKMQVTGQGNFSFWSWNAETECSIQISTGSNNPEDGDFEEILQFGNDGLGWNIYNLDLSDYSGSDVYIAFRAEPGVIDWTIDDVSFSDSFTPGTISGTISLNSGEGFVENTLISVAGQTAYPDENGQYSINIAPGTYTVTANLEGYETASIEGVSVEIASTTENIDLELFERNYNPIQNLEINSQSGTITWDQPELNNDKQELIYDDGTPNNAVSEMGAYFGNRISPESECKLLSLKFFTYAETDTVSFDAKIIGWNGSSPTDEIMFTALEVPAVAGGWSEIDLSDHDFYIEDDFIAVFQAWQPVALMCDDNNDNGRAWKGYTTEWTQEPYSYFVRATVEYPDGKIRELGKNKEIINYNIFLDDMENPIEQIDWESYTFENLNEDQSYTAGVQAVYNSGVSEIETIDFTFSTVNTNDVNFVNDLKGNYPNPFNPQTTIKFELKEKSNVNIIIYNILGQRVKTLVKDEMSSGKHSVIWNGKNDSDNSVSSGVYFYKMNTKNFSETHKMILMK